MARTHHAETEPEHAPPPPPRVAPMPGMMTIVSDRNLIDELRQIYQMAQRHKPVPPGAHLNQSLVDAVEQCAEIAEKAVTAYKG
jgi:hypothetical protein